jgi:hypothetical protein
MPRSGASIPLFMSPEDSSFKDREPSAASFRNVTLSRWLNQRHPAWEQRLNAYHVARLTRRPRWWLESMAVFGRFPRKQRFQGRGASWLTTDVLGWLANRRTGAGPNPQRNLISQKKPPLKRTTTCSELRSRRVCSVSRAIRQ